MVTEIGGASIASQIQSAIRTTETSQKPAATPVNAEPAAEVRVIQARGAKAHLALVFEIDKRLRHLPVQKERDGGDVDVPIVVKIVNHGNPNMTYGRQFDHNHQPFSKVNRASIDALKKYFKDDMQDADWRLVIKLKKVFSVI